MTVHTQTQRAIDRIAIALSGLCLVHCVATALLIGTLSAVGGMLGSPIIHEVGLVVATVLAIVALGSGIAAHGRLVPITIGSVGVAAMATALMMPHGGAEMIATMVGVALLATGHLLNRAPPA